MANHWYFGNNDKKEYIQCPFDCPTKLNYNTFFDIYKNCVMVMMDHLFQDDWHENSVSLYLDCPWYEHEKDHQQWTDITQKVMNKFGGYRQEQCEKIHEPNKKNFVKELRAEEANQVIKFYGQYIKVRE